MTHYVGVRLVRRPEGTPAPGDFDIAELKLPPVRRDEVQVENQFFSVDPFMRRRMSQTGSMMGGYPLGEVMTGEAVGLVTESETSDFAVGDLVAHHHGWRTKAVVPASECRKLRPLDGVQYSAYLGILGRPGWTAWVGVHEAARLREGDRVFVSAASGAVGSAAGQFAALLGASSVIGSTGSAEKAKELVDRFGFDHAFSHRDRPIAESLREAAPDGIDVYFDNVGGEHLQAGWDALRKRGRIAVCGQIAEYNGAELPGLRNITFAIQRQLTLRGFAVIDFPETRAPFEEQVATWLVAGKLAFNETVFDGIDHSIDAFLSVFSGDKRGKVVVSVAH